MGKPIVMIIGMNILLPVATVRTLKDLNATSMVRVFASTKNCISVMVGFCVMMEVINLLLCVTTALIQTLQCVRTAVSVLALIVFAMATLCAQTAQMR